MSNDVVDFGKSILDSTIADLKSEYDQIPESVKKVMPKVALLIAQGALAGTLDEPASRDLKHAMAIMANIKVGGRIALNELMLEKAADILAFGLKFIRGIVGL